MRHHPLLVLQTLLLLTACTGPGTRESATEPLADIVIEKKGSTAGGDCAVSVLISNRMRGSDWDGASYHLSLLNRSGKHAGRLMGAPHRPILSGRDLADSGRVTGVRCEDIGGAELVYLGYYPKGKAQQNMHIHRVRISVK